jgi:tRNA-specific adenosine deaminase 3
VIDDLSSTLETVTVCTIPVPLLAPTSQEQATLWTSTYWPTVYKKSNPFGPHFAVVAKAENDIREDVEKWMNMAEEVAKEVSITGSGEQIGVVVVERKEGIARPVVVAGDARWQDWPRSSSGNATAHAALRAIAMVAAGLKLREGIEQGNEHATEPDGPLIFQDQPLGNFEQENYHPSTSTDGYLCHDLEIYCTHEPCVMCSMAFMHSRFGKVVFRQRMPRTGGMCADGELGHGLFWRKELNWQLLAWHWSCGDDIMDEDAGTQLLQA